MKLRLLSVFAPLLFVACAVETPAPGDEEEAAVSDAEIRSSCATPRRFYAAFPSRTCPTVQGNAGAWVAESGRAFEDAPASIASCVMRWTGRRSSSPDRAALEAALSVGGVGVLTPACGRTATVTKAELRRAEDLGGIGPMGGAVGCDVCGGNWKDKFGRDRIGVIIPGDLIGTPILRLRLSNGMSEVFEVHEARPGALEMELPAPPEGTSYVEGPVTVTMEP